MSHTLLMITGDAGEALEIFYPKHRLEEKGWRVDVATLEKQAIQTVVHDFEPGFATYTERLGYRIEAYLAISEVRPVAYDGLIVPGGRAPEYLRNRPEVVAIARHFLDARKPIAATCHALLILAAASSLRRRTLTCYPNSNSTFGRREAISLIGMSSSMTTWSRRAHDPTMGLGCASSSGY